MYQNFIYKGKTLSEWQKELKFQFSLGELYRLALQGKDLSAYMKS